MVITSFSDCYAPLDQAVVIYYWRQFSRLKLDSERARVEDMFSRSFRNWCIAKFCCILRF